MEDLIARVEQEQDASLAARFPVYHDLGRITPARRWSHSKLGVQTGEWPSERFSEKGNQSFRL
jgi:hypothetical protein